MVLGFTTATQGEPGRLWFDWWRILPPQLGQTPRIVNATVPHDDWWLLGQPAAPGADPALSHTANLVTYGTRRWNVRATLARWAVPPLEDRRTTMELFPTRRPPHGC